MPLEQSASCLVLIGGLGEVKKIGIHLPELEGRITLSAVWV